ncbi:MAG: Uma2 family endonuclease, partial [Bacteroidia bacterium]
AQEKHEFVNGALIPMAGGTYFHSLIASNILFTLRFILGKTNDKFNVLGSDIKLWIEKFQTSRYPDVVIIADEVKFLKKRTDVITNPYLIVEVLSESTKVIDLGVKFEEYHSLESLQTYIIVHQDQPLLSVYQREDVDLWRIKSYQGLDAIAEIPSMEIALPLADVYDQIGFNENSVD